MIVVVVVVALLHCLAPAEEGAKAGEMGEWAVSCSGRHRTWSTGTYDGDTRTYDTILSPQSPSRRVRQLSSISILVPADEQPSATTTNLKNIDQRTDFTKGNMMLIIITFPEDRTADAYLPAHAYKKDPAAAARYASAYTTPQAPVSSSIRPYRRRTAIIILLTPWEKIENRAIFYK